MADVTVGDVTYPTRCRIVDVTGESIPTTDGMRLAIATPAASRPHVGKEGLAELVDDGEREDVRITLDDGTVLWGYECWWEAIMKEMHRG